MGRKNYMMENSLAFQANEASHFADYIIANSFIDGISSVLA